MKDEDIDALFAAHAGNGRTTRISGGGPEDIHEAALFLQNIGKEIAQKLQRHILEGQGWAVKQLQDVEFALTAQRCHLGMIKTGVGLLDQLFKVALGDIVNKQGEDCKGELLVAHPLPAIKGGAIYRWQILR